MQTPGSSLPSPGPRPHHGHRRQPPAAGSAPAASRWGLSHKPSCGKALGGLSALGRPPRGLGETPPPGPVLSRFCVTGKVTCSWSLPLRWTAGPNPALRPPVDVHARQADRTPENPADAASDGLRPLLGSVQAPLSSSGGGALCQPQPEDTGRSSQATLCGWTPSDQVDTPQALAVQGPDTALGRRAMSRGARERG